MAKGMGSYASGLAKSSRTGGIGKQVSAAAKARNVTRKTARAKPVPKKKRGA